MADFTRLLTAFVIGKAYRWLKAALAKLCQPFEEKQSILVSFGAACIFLLLFNAKILFSGQSFMHLVPSFGSQQAWYILVVAAIMKLSIFTSLFTDRLDRWRYFSRRFFSYFNRVCGCAIFPNN